MERTEQNGGQAEEYKSVGAVLAALFWNGEDETLQQESLQELAGLAETAGFQVAGVLTQQRDRPDTRTCLGEGKLRELSQFVKANGAELILFGNELTPSQIKNIEKACDCRVFDYSMLILEIFDRHAVTREGRLQVEMAQLQYTLPRLTGRGIELSRLGGGGGGGGAGARRGKGETLLELQRRNARRRMAALRAELAALRRTRGEQRRARMRSELPRVAIMGYTNAGKSTLLNTLTGAGVLAEDKLFATLDPVTRMLTLPGGSKVLLSDTVGLIRNLPHHLIEAFASTLEEVSQADLLLHVVDASSPACDRQIAVCRELIEQLGAGHLPVVTALNKIDLCSRGQPLPHLPDSVEISAVTGRGVDRLLQAVENTLAKSRQTAELLFPYAQGRLVEQLRSHAEILELDYREDGIFLRVRAAPAALGRVAAWRVYPDRHRED